MNKYGGKINHPVFFSIIRIKSVFYFLPPLYPCMQILPIYDEI